MLDFSLTTAQLRTTFISNLLPTLSTYELSNPNLMEYITNYILAPDPDPQTLPTSKPNTTDINALKDILPEPTQPETPYTSPKSPPPDWKSPELKARHKSIQHLKARSAQLNSQGHLHDAYILRKLARELTIEGGYVTSIQPKPYAPTTPPNAIDWDNLIDWSNPFHIKQLLKHYSALKASGNSWEAMEYLDQLCEAANLKIWEHQIILRSVDGWNAITIGLELAQDFDRSMSPSYLSQAKRNIYQKIAKTAHLHKLQHLNRDNPDAWATCAKCGTKKLLHSANFGKQLNRTTTICKACRGNKSHLSCT